MGTYVFANAHMGKYVCVRLFLNNAGWVNGTNIWNNFAISTMLPSCERKEVEF